jgi:hypothetical protein
MVRPVRHGKWATVPVDFHAAGICHTPADATGVGSSSSLARNRLWPLIALARGLRTAALVDVVAHMRSAKVELMARTVADAAVALRTVPAGRKQRTFLCVHYQRARIPDGTTMPDLQDFRCAVALRCDGRRASNWSARASFTSAAESGQCVFLQSVRNSACTVEGRIATRTASVHERAAQISIANRAGHDCSSSCTSGLTTFVESLRTVRGARAAESVCVRLRWTALATRPATVELLRVFTCHCNGRRAETIAASRPALVRCAVTVEAEVRGSAGSTSDRFVQTTRIAAWLLQT